jgi:pyridoxamine 5'-phosphate oxidase
MINFEKIRKEYLQRTLDEHSVNTDPFEQFNRWFREVIESGIDEPSAMFLATSGPQGEPSGRMVLLKGISEEGFIFFTNYNSQKGREIRENPNVALVFFWKELERQVRITGVVARIPAKDSDEYFQSRPFESRVSAVISDQSSVIPDREYLELKKKNLLKSIENEEIIRPSHWGGFIVKPTSFEFWQGRASRLHDRIRYRLDSNKWIIERLSP